jgi:hypothetical protein
LGKTGARLGQDWGKTGARLGQDWGKTGASLGQDNISKTRRLILRFSLRHFCKTASFGEKAFFRENPLGGTASQINQDTNIFGNFHKYEVSKKL